jgi:hypothetical protein
MFQSGTRGVQGFREVPKGSGERVDGRKCRNVLERGQIMWKRRESSRK